MDGPPDFVDREGALFQLPPLFVVEDLREAVNFGWGVRVQCVLGGRVLLEEAILGCLEHDGRVVGEGAPRLPDRGDGAVAGVNHGVAEVADCLVGEFMLRIPFVLLGDALLPVDVPLLQVCPDVGYLRPAAVDVSAGVGGVGVEEGCHLLFRMPEVRERVPQGCWRSVILSLGVLRKTAGDDACTPIFLEFVFGIFGMYAKIPGVCMLCGAWPTPHTGLKVWWVRVSPSCCWTRFPQMSSHVAARCLCGRWGSGR